MHIRNLPPDIEQEEVFSLAERFGSVRNCLMLRSKNQALLEMYDQGVAMSMVASYTAAPPIMRCVVRESTLYIPCSYTPIMKCVVRESPFYLLCI